jgi:L-threonylcarbamoyladenylate synthase
MSKHVIDDMTGRIDAIIDGGSCDVGVESTIVDASRDIPVLLRPGGISYESLCDVVPETIIEPHILESLTENEKPLCPGMKYKHYAPDAEVTVIEGDKAAVKLKIDELLKNNSDKICGVLTMSENAYDSAVILHGGTTNKEFAKNLFANLREFDKLGVEVVFAEFESRDGYGLAIKNRLYKSAAHRVIHV